MSILTNIVSFWYAKKCHFMDIIDKKCQFYVYKLTIMAAGTISRKPSRKTGRKKGATLKSRKRKGKRLRLGIGHRKLLKGKCLRMRLVT